MSTKQVNMHEAKSRLSELGELVWKRLGYSIGSLLRGDAIPAKTAEEITIHNPRLTLPVDIFSRKSRRDQSIGAFYHADR